MANKKATLKEQKSALAKELAWLEDRLQEGIDKNSIIELSDKINVQNVRTLRMKALFLVVYAKSFSVTAACRRLSIGRQTYYDWCMKDRNFKHMVDEVAESQIDLVEDMAIKKILQGDSRLIEFYLRTKGKTRGYTEEVTSYDDDVIEFTLKVGRKDLSKPTEEKLLPPANE